MTLIQWILRMTRGRSGFVCLGSPCGAGRSVATVLADGDVGPCDSIYSDKFFHRDVDHYIKGLGDDAHLRGLLERNVRTIEPCSKCDVQAHCNGTCPGQLFSQPAASSQSIRMSVRSTTKSFESCYGSCAIRRLDGS